MKNILNSSLVTLTFSLALAMQAHAAPNWATLYSGAYSKDTTPSTEGRANYTAYYCTVAAAQTMFGGADTIEGIETYLKANFTTGKSAMDTTAGSYALTQGDYGKGQYSFVSYFADPIAEGSYFSVAFYQNDAFRVFSSADVDSGNLTFDDTSALTTSGSWTTVPEPTSGMLLLLGFAALGLRRKQRG